MARLNRAIRDMEGLIEALNLEDVVDRGDEIGARCPMHEKRTGQLENHPRHWSVNKTTGQHHCFSCGYKGGVLTLIMDVMGVNLWEASRFIRTFGVDLTFAPPEKTAEEPLKLPPVPLGSFPEPPERPLRHRKLSRAAVTHYGLRWDPEEAGWVIPIRSPTGTPWGYQIKTADWVRNVPRGIKKAKTLFGLKEFSGTKVIVVESPLDVVYLHTLGWEEEGLALFGSSISKDQEALIKERAVAVILALDNDNSGRTETEKILRTGFGNKLHVKVINYKGSQAKDPGEMSEPELRHALATSIPSVFWKK